MKFTFNATEEQARYHKNVGLDITLLNAFAYSLELIFFPVSMVITIIYLIVSKMNRNFHSMLRILMNLMCCGMLINSFFRLLIVPVRLFLGRDYNVEWVSPIDKVCQSGQLIAILQIDTTVFLISIERLIATIYIKRYEHMLSSLAHRIILTALLLGSLYGLSYYLFISRGDVYLEKSQTTLIVIAYVMTATNLMGMVLLRITHCRSRHHLTVADHALSKSYQCRENLRVVRLVSPIYVLLFITRLCQFAFRIYSYYVGFRLGAFMFRLLAHMYNMSLTASVFLTPLLLILLQPKFSVIFFKRSLRKLNYAHHDAGRNTAIYFDSLRKMWT